MANVSAEAGFAFGDDRFDDVVCLPASVWGFDLRPYRGERVNARRKRSRFAWMAAVCCGFSGAVLLQSWSHYERHLEHERASAIARRVDALAPALTELRQWQILIDADSARRAGLEALAPRRTQLLRLFDMLAAATRTGVRIVDMQMRQIDAATPTRAVAEKAIGRVDVDARGLSEISELRLHIAGLADDADTLARWAADLAAQPGVLSVDLDGVHKLEDRRPAPSTDLGIQETAPDREADVGIAGQAASPGQAVTPRLNAFRLTLTWRDPAAKPTAISAASRHASLTSTSPAALSAP